jgi:DUF1365 family protein
MHSCLYTGNVRHRRHEPTTNRFTYKLFMAYLDLAELPHLFDQYLLWSARRPAPAWFRRGDFYGNPAQPLDEAVRDLVAKQSGSRPAGPIRLLTHLRYFGYSFNPVSFYYCFDRDDTKVETIVAEITNTPWKERHQYVLPVGSATESGSCWRFRFEKDFHVSPFLPMDMSYDWRFSAPDEHLRVHMQNWRNGAATFDATLCMAREPITSVSLAHALVHFPLLTAQVTTFIHWQALRLWLKRTPFYAHPSAPVHASRYTEQEAKALSAKAPQAILPID